jgi:hypothetical protein
LCSIPDRLMPSATGIATASPAVTMHRPAKKHDSGPSSGAGRSIPSERELDRFVFISAGEGDADAQRLFAKHIQKSRGEQRALAVELAEEADRRADQVLRGSTRAASRMSSGSVQMTRLDGSLTPAQSNASPLPLRSNSASATKMNVLIARAPWLVFRSILIESSPELLRQRPELPPHHYLRRDINAHGDGGVDPDQKVKYRPGSTPFSTRRRSRTLGHDGSKPRSPGASHRPAVTCHTPYRGGVTV